MSEKVSGTFLSRKQSTLRAGESGRAVDIFVGDRPYDYSPVPLL